MKNYKYVPRNYWFAAKLLFDRRVQRLACHDDLVLAFIQQGIAILYKNRPIVRWSEDGRLVALRASRQERGATTLVVEYISWFLPCGWHVQHRAGRMLLHAPTGRTTVGNEQTIFLPGQFEFDFP